MQTIMNIHGILINRYLTKGEESVAKRKKNKINPFILF